MNLESLEKSDYVIYRVLSGSHSYSLNIDSSDRDYKGIFIIPPEKYLSLQETIEQVNDARNDVSYYSLRRFLELASTANPNIIEMLYVDKEYHQTVSPEMNLLLSNRSIFISKKCVDPHLRYAEAQIKKAKGRNKWVNNPQPVDPPKRTDYCWITPVDAESQLRPVAVKDLSIDFGQYEVSSLEHHKGVYRLYKVGEGARGVFAEDGQIKCQSIPKEYEVTRLAGLLTVNEEAFQRALKDHKHYWQWTLNRNENRWQQQETGELDYDAKNMMHTIRLLYSGINILKNGEPLVSFSGDKREFLLGIRSGKFSYDELLGKAESLAEEMKALNKKTQIPEAVDVDKIDQLHLEIYELWQSRVK